MGTAQGYDFIFKTDDDTLVMPKKLLATDFQKHDYIGRYRGPSGTYPCYRGEQLLPNGKEIYGDKESGFASGLGYPSADVVHFKGLGFDGLVGLSPIKYFMKNAVGLALAAEKFGSRFYANNGRPGGILIYKGMKLDQTQKQNIKDSWQEAQAGKNQGRPAVLTGDWDWKEMNIPAEEAQFLQTRKHQAEQAPAKVILPRPSDKPLSNRVIASFIAKPTNCSMTWPKPPSMEPAKKPWNCSFPYRF